MEFITPITINCTSYNDGIELKSTRDEFLININNKQIQTHTVNGWLYIDAKELSSAICEDIEGEQNNFIGEMFPIFKISSEVEGKIKVLNIQKLLAQIDRQKKINRGTIYLISDGQYTKIGATTYNPEKRRNELQTGNPRCLKILGTYITKNRFIQEQKLHNDFSHKNILGEWFDLTDYDVSEILDSGDGNYYEPITYFLSKENQDSLIALQKQVKTNFAITLHNIHTEMIWDFLFTNFSEYSEVIDNIEDDNIQAAISILLDLIQKGVIPNNKLEEQTNKIKEMIDIHEYLLMCYREIGGLGCSEEFSERNFALAKTKDKQG